jgi:molecular chaperone GrpE (heat shock protein)
MFDWNQLLSERDAEIENLRKQVRELEARLLVVRAEMHESRNEADTLQQRLNRMVEEKRLAGLGAGPTNPE